MRIFNSTPLFKETKVVAQKFYNITDAIFLNSLIKEESSATDLLSTLTRNKPEELEAALGAKTLEGLNEDLSDIRHIFKLEKGKSEKEYLLSLFKHHKLVDEKGDFTSLPARWTRYKGNAESYFRAPSNKIIIYGKPQSPFKKMINFALARSPKRVVLTTDSILLKGVNNPGLSVTAKQVNVIGDKSHLGILSGEKVIVKGQDIKFLEARAEEKFLAQGSGKNASISGDFHTYANDSSVIIKDFKNANISGTSQGNLKIMRTENLKIWGYAKKGKIAADNITIDKNFSFHTYMDFRAIGNSGKKLNSFTGEIKTSFGDIDIQGFKNIEANLNSGKHTFIYGADSAKIKGSSYNETLIDSNNIHLDQYKSGLDFIANGEGNASGTMESYSGKVSLSGYKDVNIDLTTSGIPKKINSAAE